MPEPEPDPDLAVRLARLHACVAAKAPDYHGAILVSVDCLAELIRQRAALAAKLEAARARCEGLRAACASVVTAVPDEVCDPAFRPVHEQCRTALEERHA